LKIKCPVPAFEGSGTKIDPAESTSPKLADYIWNGGPVYDYYYISLVPRYVNDLLPRDKS
jgi:hypothetical protein